MCKLKKDWTRGRDREWKHKIKDKKERKRKTKRGEERRETKIIPHVQTPLSFQNCSNTYPPVNTLHPWQLF